MLWPTIQFSREREDKIKKLLINYFHPGEKWKNRLMIDMNSFCERILLVKKYLEKDVCRFVPVPEKFFDPYFESGFIGTEKWLKNVQLKRKENKLFYYNHRLLILCFRNYGNDPNINNYNKGRKLLSRKKCDWLLDEYDKLVMGISELNNDRNYLYKKYVLNNYE
jgi:hypothetical protein